MIVVISGASSGIGLDAATHFAQNGHTVYALSRSGKVRAGSTPPAAELDIRHLKVDVTNAEAVKQAVALIEAEHGVIDVVIANAGYGISGSFEEHTEAEWKQQIDVNLFGVIHLVQAVLPNMREHKAGKIIITSSLAGKIAIPYQSYYSASKAALNSLCLALQNEVHQFGITCVALMLGDISTQFTAQREKTFSNFYPKLNASIAKVEKDEQSGQSSKAVAERMYKIATGASSQAPLQTLGASYQFVTFLAHVLPSRASNFLVRKLYA